MYREGSGFKALDCKQEDLMQILRTHISAGWHGSQCKSIPALDGRDQGGLQSKLANHASHTGEVRVCESPPWRIEWKRNEGRLLTSTLSLHMHVRMDTHTCQHTCKHVCYIYMKIRKSKKCTGNEKEKNKRKRGIEKRYRTQSRWKKYW